MLKPNDLPLMCLPVDLSEEAAAQIAEFLTQLALTFENTHYSQIRRHYETQRPPSDYDPRQLELFDPF